LRVSQLGTATADITADGNITILRSGPLTLDIIGNITSTSATGNVVLAANYSSKSTASMHIASDASIIAHGNYYIFGYSEASSRSVINSIATKNPGIGTVTFLGTRYSPLPLLPSVQAYFAFVRS
jgi:hypothetical protein